MARSIVERDLSELLLEKGIILNGTLDNYFQKTFGDKFYDDMDKRQKKLSDLEQQLDNAEDKLRLSLKKIFFDSDSIIDDIIYHLNTGKDMPQISQLLGIDSSDLLLSLDKVFDDYVEKYNNYKTEMIDNIKYIGEIGETIRGDKQYYTIGIDTSKNGPLRRVVLNSEQWYNLISKNEYFSLQRDANGRRVLASNRQWTGETRTKINPKTGKEIQEKILSPTRGITGGTLAQGVLQAINPKIEVGKKDALRALNADKPSQEIWKALKQSKIYTMKSLQMSLDTDDPSQLKAIFNSRKFEILNSGIWDSVYATTDPKSRAQQIHNIIKEIQSQGFEIENIFGGAKGDVMLRTDSGYISNQVKYFGTAGKTAGIQVIEVRGLNNAMSFYKDRNNIQEADQKAIMAITGTPEGQSAIIQGGMMDYSNGANSLFSQFFLALTGMGISIEGDTEFTPEDMAEATDY